MFSYNIFQYFFNKNIEICILIFIFSEDKDFQLLF